MALHGELTGDQIHVPYAWSYADAAARGAAAGFVPGDVGKFALQQDDHTLWMLTDDGPIAWIQVGGAGAVASVNGQTGAVVLTPDDLDDSTTANKFATAAELTKLAGIEAGADVTDAANVAAAGAVMAADTSAAGFGFVVDDDTMAGAVDTMVPTQQSVKAYVDAQVLAAGSYSDEKARDAIGAALVGGTGITVTPDDVADTITIAGTVTQYTDEMARDAIGAALVGSNAVTVTPNDAGDVIAVSAPWQRFALTWVIDEGAVPATGVKQWLVVPCDCSIVEHYLLADQAGSIVLDVWKDSYANYPPTVADTITASAKPTLSSAAKAHDSTLAGWSKTLAGGDVVGISIDSVATVTKVTLALICARTA